MPADADRAVGFLGWRVRTQGWMIQNPGQLQKANTRKFAQQADMLARLLA